MNKPVSFPLARLLKDKNIHILSAKSMYASNGELTDAVYDFDNWCFAPTISDVVMWLYEKHKIWISVYEYKDHAADSNDLFVFRSSVTGLKEFKTPTEAYSAAIEFVLNNRLTSQTK